MIYHDYPSTGSDYRRRRLVNWEAKPFEMQLLFGIPLKSPLFDSKLPQCDQMVET